MTIKEALRFGEIKLKNFETPHLDAAVLLAFVIKKQKIFLYAHNEKILTSKQWRGFQKLIKRRMKHEPIAYLISEKEFYGRTFFVDKRVLIPRPETELLIDLTKTIKAKTIIDVGTGSGAIAITLAKELNREVLATDISKEALKIAKRNTRTHHAKVKFFCGNLLEPILKLKISAPVLIVANLPYLPTTRNKYLPPDVKKYEPRLALMGGQDGLKYYRELLGQIKNSAFWPWTLIAEIDATQEKTFARLVKKILPGAELNFTSDLNGLVRIATVKPTSEY